MFAAVHESTADSLMAHFFSRRADGYYKVGEFFGDLYVKQRVGVFKNNLALNTFPDMTRFDRGVDNYVTELFYQLHYTDYGVLELRRKAYNTSFKHGRGEIERVVEFMTVNPCDATLLNGRIFSPLHREYAKYYIYSLDSLSSNAKGVRISFVPRFDNIRLLSCGSVWLDDSCNIVEFAMSGWDEQSKFDVVYKMGVRGDVSGVVESVHADISYNFLGNKLSIAADGCFDYDYVIPVNRAVTFRSNTSEYDLSGSTHVAWDTTRIDNMQVYADENRPLRLDWDEIELLADYSDSIQNDNNKKNIIWNMGDAMISSHSYDWNSGGIKFSPIVNPSSVDYSSGRGLSYKFSMNIRNSMRNNREMRLKPQVGYNFKQKTFYWNVRGHFVYDPLHIGVLGLDFGEGNRSYSSAALERIKNMALDSLDFKSLNLSYFRNFYVETFHEREIVNGLSMLVGVNYHKRTLRGDADKQLENYGVPLRKKYVQFAPHVRFTWRPGMYYYMKEGRKINLGSDYPVFAWDVEQGINGVLGSNSIYMRSEFDVQYKLGLRSGNLLYMRLGAGGYFYTKDVYFVDYSFLKQSNLPVERSEELGGVFQLLDSEWYNAANKYARVHLTYDAPFLSLQKLFPRVKLFQNEYIYYNMLFMSQLHPYAELGYGVATPYVNMGFFVSSENLKMHSVGYKISLSLFAD